MSEPREIEELAEEWLSDQDCTCDEPELGACWYHLEKDDQIKAAFRCGYWRGETEGRHEKFEQIAKLQAEVERLKEELSFKINDRNALQFSYDTCSKERAQLRLIAESYRKMLSKLLENPNCYIPIGLRDEARAALSKEEGAE